MLAGEPVAKVAEALEVSPDTLYKWRRQALIDNAANAKLSKKLVTLDHKAPMPCPLSHLAVKPVAERYHEHTDPLGARGDRRVLA